MAAQEALLRVEGLSVRLPSGADRALAVEEVSFELRRGEILCIVGESGSGKSITANTIMGLLPRPYVEPVAGRILFEGRDLLREPEPALRALRGSRIGMIFQEPMTRSAQCHASATRLLRFLMPMANSARRAVGQVRDLLASVGLPDPDTLGESYPFACLAGSASR